MIFPILIGLGILILLKKPSTGVVVQTNQNIQNVQANQNIISSVIQQGIETDESFLDNPAMRRIVSQLASLSANAIQGTGVFAYEIGLSQLASEAGTIGGSMFNMGLNLFMSGQSTFTNPYSGYVEAGFNLLGSFGLGVPILGTVLGGFLEGIIGEGAPPEPLDRDWIILLKRREKLNTGFKLPYELEMGRGSPTYHRVGYIPKIPTDETEKTWYFKDYAPTMARLFSYRSWFIKAVNQAEENPLPDWLSNLLIKVSPNLDIFHSFQKERDKPYIADLIGGYRFIPFDYSGSALMSNSIPEGLIPFVGINPFLGLTENQINFFYTSVLPEIDNHVFSGWYGWEDLKAGLSVKEEEPLIFKNLM